MIQNLLAIFPFSAHLLLCKQIHHLLIVISKCNEFIEKISIFVIEKSEAFFKDQGLRKSIIKSAKRSLDKKTFQLCCENLHVPKSFLEEI